MLEQDNIDRLATELRELLQAQKTFAARLDSNLESLLCRAEAATVQNLARADELASGLRTLGLEREQYLEQTAGLHQGLADADHQIEELTTKLAAASTECLEEVSVRERLAHENSILQTEQQRMRRELISLRHDVALKEAYLVEVRRRASADAQEAAQKVEAQTEMLREQLAGARAEAEMLRELFARSREEVEALNVTLRLPRYRAADALNDWLRRLPPVHAALKTYVVRR